MKRPPMHNVLRYISFSLVGLSLLMGGFGTVLANGVSQGYVTSDTELKPGYVAALSDEGDAANPSVVRGSSDAPMKIIGVATDASSSLVVISSGKKEVYIQSGGDVATYVADINGEVKRGDQLTISPLRGILMKADGLSKVILGTALEDFSTQQSTEYTVQSSDGDKKTKVARIGVNLDQRGSGAQQSSKGQLSAVGKALTGKEVGDIRVLIALVIFLLILIAEGGIIYGAVSSAITALGRNPLASKVIRRELIRVLLVAIFVLIVGLGSIYGVLWS